MDVCEEEEEDEVEVEEAKERKNPVLTWTCNDSLILLFFYS